MRPTLVSSWQWLRHQPDLSGTFHRQADRFIGVFRDSPKLVFQTVRDGCEHVYHLMAPRYNSQPYGKTRDDLINCCLKRIASSVSCTTGRCIARSC